MLKFNYIFNHVNTHPRFEQSVIYFHELQRGDTNIK